MTHLKSKKHILLAASMTSALITLSATQEALANTRYYDSPTGKPAIELNLDVIGSTDKKATSDTAAPIKLNPNYASASKTKPAPASKPAPKRDTITLKPTRAMLEKQRKAEASAQQYAPIANPEPQPVDTAEPFAPTSLATNTSRNSPTADAEIEKRAAPKVSDRPRRSTTFTRADAPGIADVETMAPRSLPPLEQAHRTSERPSEAPSRPATKPEPKPAYQPAPVDSSSVEMPEIEVVKSTSNYDPAPEPVAEPVSQPVPETRPEPISNPAYDVPPIEEVTISQRTPETVTQTQPVPSQPPARPAAKKAPPRPSFFDVIERSVDRLAGDVKNNTPSPTDVQASYTPEQGYAPIPNAELFDPRKKEEDSSSEARRLTEAAVKAHEAKAEPTTTPQRETTPPTQRNPDIKVEVTQPAPDVDQDMAPVSRAEPQNIKQQPSPQLPEIETVSEPMMPRRTVNPKEREDRYADDSTTRNIDSYQSQSPAPPTVSTPTPPPVSSERETLPVIDKEASVTTERQTATQETKSAPQINWNEPPAQEKPVAFKVDRSKETAAAPVDPAFDPFENTKNPQNLAIKSDTMKPEVIKPNKDEPEQQPSVSAAHNQQDRDTEQYQTSHNENNRIEPAARQASPSQQAAAPRNTADTDDRSSIDQSLVFDGANSDLKPELQQNLDSVIAELEADENRRLQLRSYAASTDGSSSSARRVALGRAIKVRKYFMDQGIRSTRIDVRALGDETEQTPLNRVDMVLVR
ncbi:MAG: OmpA family protein [Pseudomonadota bacterium]